MGSDRSPCGSVEVQRSASVVGMAVSDYDLRYGRSVNLAEVVHTGVMVVFAIPAGINHDCCVGTEYQE
jgi:hypothetical protein